MDTVRGALMLFVMFGIPIICITILKLKDKY